jgi:hypothetical protein
LVRVADKSGLLRYTPCVHNEHSLMAAFVKRNKRDRYREILSNPRLRHKFTDQLAHFSDFDPKYRLPIPSNELFVDNIAFELQKRHSPSVISAISEDPALDQKDLPLVEALNQIVGRGIGTILSCIPGRLAFVETEDERFILERHGPLEKREYIRFVIEREDEDSHVEQGIFQAAALAIEWQGITGIDADELNRLLAWFNENLEKPTSFGRDKLRLGICWFKTGSTEYISRIWEMVRILERNSIYVKKIRTDKPGYVIYEDQWQLVAEPFRQGTMSRR